MPNQQLDFWIDILSGSKTYLNLPFNQYSVFCSYSFQ